MQADMRGTLRKVWLFEFRIHKQPDVVSINEASIISAALLDESRKENPLSEEEREVADLSIDPKQTIATPALFEIEGLRSRLLQIQPYKFEQFIKTVMEVNGFSNVAVTNASGDGGIDLNAYVGETNDFFAGTHVQVQVKRWRHVVGSVEINKFRGALSLTAKGVLLPPATTRRNHRSQSYVQTLRNSHRRQQTFFNNHTRWPER
jgi:restriction endonuclease Mrr